MLSLHVRTLSPECESNLICICSQKAINPSVLIPLFWVLKGVWYLVDLRIKVKLLEIWFVCGATV